MCDFSIIEDNCRRSFYENLFINFKDFADTNFCDQFNNPKHTSQRIWEMYFCNVLLNKGFNIENKNNIKTLKTNEGPDFILKNGIYIECVAPTNCVANNDEETFILNRNKQKLYTNDENLRNKILFKIINSILQKYKKYKEKWYSKEWFHKEYPFIIALNINEIGCLQDSLSFNYVLMSLFGIYECKYNSNTKKFFIEIDNSNIINEESIIKNDLFKTNEYEEISGIIFSNDDSFFHKNNIGRDCYFVPNPYAKNIVQNKFLQKFNNYVIKTSLNINLVEKNN